LGLDLEISANDSLDADREYAWYRRCFLRRYSVSEKIAGVCPVLEQCEWKQPGFDNQGNDQQHDFVIREENGNRIVRPVMQWWMVGWKKDRYGGPLPMDVMVKEDLY
jgi:hypothetical protein